MARGIAPRPIDMDLAVRLKEAGAPWAVIGRMVGLDPEAVRERLDPTFHAHRRARLATARRRRIRHEQSYVGTVWSARQIASLEDPHESLSWREIAARLALRPPDRRSLTGKICGDPLPGESALDREMRQ